MFKIEGYDYNFKIGHIKPTSLLAISTQLDFGNYKHLEECFDFALEHTEVEVNGQWFKVKEAGREVYMPANIATDMNLLKELVGYFINNVIKKVFQNSTE